MRFDSIVYRLWGLFLLVAILPLGVFGYLSIGENEQLIRTETEARLTRLADKKLLEVRKHLAARVEYAALLARGELVGEAVQALAAAYPARQRDAARYERLDRRYRSAFAAYVEDTDWFYDLFLISPQGEVIYTHLHEADFATNLLHGRYRDTQLAQAFRESRMTLEPSVSDFELYAPSNQPAAFITIPIMRGNMLTGVLAVQLNTTEIYKTALDSIGLGRTGETEFAKYDRDGQALLTAPLKFDDRAAMQRKIMLNERNASPMRHALLGERGVGDKIDYRGKEVIAAWRYLPELRWGMVVKIDTEEVLEGTRQQRQLLFVALLGLLLFATVVAGFFGRRMVVPLRALAQTAEEVARGNLERRACEAGADEIGMLARAFNRMTENLQALYRSLEDRVAERTNELYASNEQLQEEINERREIEKALLSANDDLILYKRFIDTSTNAMGMADLKGKLIYANPALCEMLQLDAAYLEQHAFHEFYAEADLQRLLDEILPQVLKHGSWRGEMRLCGGQGRCYETIHDLHLVRNAEGEPYALANIITDISERKEAEKLSLRHKIVLETAQDGFWVADATGRLIEANAAYACMSGYTVDELLALRISDIEAAENPDEVQRHMEKIITEGFGRFETQHRHKDGHVYDVEVTTTFLRDAGQFVVFCRDISERQRAQAELRHKQELLNEAQRLGQLGSWELNLASGALYWSDEIYRIFELDPQQFSPSYENFLNVIHPDDRDRVNAAYTQSLQDKLPYDVVHRLLLKDGRIKWVREHCMSEFDADGKPLRSVGAVQDITEQKLYEDSLRVAAVAFETHEAIMITDADSRIVRVNHAFEEITGYGFTEVQGKTPRILSSGRQSKEFYAEMWRQLLSLGTWSGEIWDRRKSGEIYPKSLTITAVKNESGQTTEYVAIFSDITARKRAEEEIRNLAFYDALTKLPNRRLLLDRFHLARALSARSHHYGAVLFLDMDKFKTLNDTLGHDYGDEMLVEVALRIQSCVREVDTVARLGGDEFVVLLEEVSASDQDASQRVAQVAEKIRVALSAPYRLKGHEHHSSPSIGVALFRGTEDAVEDILKRADMAMYQAKESGRNAVRFYDPLMQQVVETRALLEADLRVAVAQGQMQLYYQVQVGPGRRALGAEALVRWNHPLRGMVSPGQFIPIAEESALIIEIGQWVLDTACRQLADWQRHEQRRHLTLAVNVSAQQFRLRDFVERVADVLQAHQVPADRLKLELTESVVLSDVKDVVAKMHALKALGVRLSLDDFGTGYSSLAYLKSLPLDQIKIDQSFVRDIVSDPNDAVMVQTIIDMAANFRLNVIAEGVETEAQYSFLKQHGCLAYQGYLFGKPIPIGQFETLLESLPPG